MAESKGRGGGRGSGRGWGNNRMTTHTRTFNSSNNNNNSRDYDNVIDGIAEIPQEGYYNDNRNNSSKRGSRNYYHKWERQGSFSDSAPPFTPESFQHGPQQYPDFQIKRQFYRNHNRYPQNQHQYPRPNNNNRVAPFPFPLRPSYRGRGGIDYLPEFARMMGSLQIQQRGMIPLRNADEEWAWHEMTYGGHGDSSHEDAEKIPTDEGMFAKDKVAEFIAPWLSQLLFHYLKPLMKDPAEFISKTNAHDLALYMGVDDFDSLSVTDSGVFSDNDGCSSGRSSPVSCKAGELGGERDRFAILTYDQVKRVDSVLNEVVALEGRGNFPALELKLKDLLTKVKDRLVQEGIKIRDIRLNGGAASYALKDRLDFCCVCGVVYTPSGEDGGLLCSCISSEGQTKNFSYNDIDLIFGMELTTAKHFDRVKCAVLDALLDLLPPQVSRKRMSPCALKEAYVSKMVKVCEGDRWSLIALGNGPAANSSSKGRSCSVELKFVDTMRRQYEFSVDSFQIVLDSLMLFYKCATVPMSSRFYPTVVGESVFGDFYGALYHLQNGLIATRHPEEIRGGGLLKYCNLLVRGYRPADIHSIPPLQRYMCSRFFIDFPEIEQQESKLRTYLANHMSGVSARLRYAFLITLYHVVDSSTVCLMGHERRLTLNLIQRLACELFSTDCGQGIYGPQPNQSYQYSSYYMPQCQLTTASSESNHPAPSANGTTYYPTPQISASTSAPAVVSATTVVQPHNYQSPQQRSTGQPKSCSTNKTLRHSQPNQTASKTSSTPAVTTVPLLTASS